MSGGIFNEAFWGVIKLKVNSWFKKYPKYHHA
jgi:dolichol-phosphate mannosyltransferase